MPGFYLKKGSGNEMEILSPQSFSCRYKGKQHTVSSAHISSLLSKPDTSCHLSFSPTAARKTPTLFNITLGWSPLYLISEHKKRKTVCLWRLVLAVKLLLIQMSPNQVHLFTALNGKSPLGLLLFVIPKVASALSLELQPPVTGLDVN